MKYNTMSMEYERMVAWMKKNIDSKWNENVYTKEQQLQQQYLTEQTNTRDMVVIPVVRLVRLLIFKYSV